MNRLVDCPQKVSSLDSLTRLSIKTACFVIVVLLPLSTAVAQIRTREIYEANKLRLQSTPPSRPTMPAFASPPPSQDVVVKTVKVKENGENRLKTLLKEKKTIEQALVALRQSKDALDAVRSIPMVARNTMSRSSNSKLDKQLEKLPEIEGQIQSLTTRNRKIDKEIDEILNKCSSR